jgi:hypothetical protein
VQPTEPSADTPPVARDALKATEWNRPSAAGDAPAAPARAPATTRVRLLPHEIIFGLFLALTWGRLAARAGVAHPLALAFLGFLLASAGVILWAGHRPTPWRWRIRLLTYPALMGLSFYVLPLAIAQLGLARADERLAGWDHALLGTHISGPLESWMNPLFTDVMMLAYLFFFYYLIAGPAHYCIRDVPRFRKCFAGLFTIYGLGFIGYTLFPAIGPYSHLHFDAALERGWFTRWVQPLVDGGSNGVDVFPSLHVAVSLYLLVFDWWHFRARFRRLVIPCVALWFSTLYLRYHYVVDLLAGAALTVVGLWVAAGYARSGLAQEIAREEALPSSPVSPGPER